MMQFVRYSLLFIFISVCGLQVNRSEAAACTLTSSVSQIALNKAYDFTTNTNGSINYGSAAGQFWSGEGSERYTCPDTTKISLCAFADGGGSSLLLAPGFVVVVYASDGSSSFTTGNYSDGCYAVSKNSGFPASDTMSDLGYNFMHYTKANAYVRITDSSVARNYAFNNLYVGYIGLQTDDSYGETPLTKIYISGTVTIPSSCSLTSGSVVNLPDTYSGEYGKAGVGVKIGTGTSQPMSIKCKGGGESAVIDLHVTTNKTSGNDIVTSNPDVGVRVLDGNGNTISANGGSVSATLVDGAVDVPFTYVPVAITGKNPTPGDYSAIETITATIP